MITKIKVQYPKQSNQTKNKNWENIAAIQFNVMLLKLHSSLQKKFLLRFAELGWKGDGMGDK